MPRVHCVAAKWFCLAALSNQIANLRAGVPGNLRAGGLAVMCCGLTGLHRSVAAGGHRLEVLLRPVALPADAVERSRREALAELFASLWIGVAGVTGVARVTGAWVAGGWVAWIARVVGVAAAASSEHQRGCDQ